MGIVALTLDADVDPRKLQINKRYKHSQNLPIDVKHAMRTIQGRVFDEVVGKSAFQFHKTYDMSLWFFFPTMASDIDGPIKHTIDAVEAGINQAMQFLRRGEKFNDNDICVLTVYKKVGPPGIAVNLYGSEQERC